jgi:hypothetical protein
MEFNRSDIPSQAYESVVETAKDHSLATVSANGVYFNPIFDSKRIILVDYPF